MTAFAPALIRPKNNAVPTQTTEQQRVARGKISSTVTSVKSASCACGGGCPKCLDTLGIQAKLKVGAPNDVYEQEADRVAEQVMRMPEPTLQRQYKGSSDVFVPIPGDEEKPQIQRLANGEISTGEVASDFMSHLGVGVPLDAASRSYFEPRFGHDFSNVRIHSGPPANRAAANIQARAFTLGRDVVFAAGEHELGSESGMRLLAHELTHVVQQLGAEGTNTGENRGLSPIVSRKESGSGLLIQRYSGHFPWAPEPAWYRRPNRYRINGQAFVNSVLLANVSNRITEISIVPGTSGYITLSLYGDYIGTAGSGLTRNPALGEFQVTDNYPFRCTPEGVLTVETSAIVRESATNDPSHRHPFGILESEIGMSFTAGSDGSSFVIETITFTSGGSGVSVGVGPVGGSTAAGTTNTHSVGMRVNLSVIGAHPAPTSATPPTARATATATATGAAPARVTVPVPHSIYFENESQTEGDTGELVRWAAGLSANAQAAIRTGRLTVTVIGYASTTGSDLINFERYSRRRAEWVRGVLGRALGVSGDTLHVGWRGEYDAPPADRRHPGGVPSARQRRADILFEETAPTNPASATASSSATAE